jgi:hypothetical protein
MKKLSLVLLVLFAVVGCRTSALEHTSEKGWKTQMIFKGNPDGISPEVSGALGKGGSNDQARVRWVLKGDVQRFSFRVQSQFESFPCTDPDAAAVDCVPIPDKGVRNPSETLLERATLKSTGTAYFHLNEPMNHPDQWTVHYIIYVDFLGSGSYGIAMDSQI